VAACHDVSDGGVLVAVTEMALAAGLGLDLQVQPPGSLAHAHWFGEDQGRYVLAADVPEAVLEQARAAGVPARVIGIVTAEPRLTLPGEVPISLEDMRRANEAWLPRFMAG
jgi:phosphoribosylformylglycinamidine synthase